MTESKQKNLTLRYGATQFTYWAASTGATSFATTYLLSKGLPSGTVGALLAAAGLLACVTQPLLAAAADRAKRFMLTKMLMLLSTLCAACFAVQLLPNLPLMATGLLYMAGIWSSESMFPLLSAMSFSYRESGHVINYGAARAVGAAASATTSLVLGFVIAKLGLYWMLIFLLAVRAANILLLAGFPRIDKPLAAPEKHEKSCSIPYFFAHYRWYCISLLGVLFLGMYHAMTENFLIAIMQRLGGDSRHVGTALFIASMAVTPTIFCFAAIRKRIPDGWLLKIAALSFLAQAVLYDLAQSVTAVWLCQLIQLTSYAFLEPALVYYANAKVRSCDMVKGQAFATAAYALGCSAGNFAGGQLLRISVDAMLAAGIAMAAAGTAVLFLTVDRSDVPLPPHAET